MVDASHRSLIRDMKLALLSEIGARAIYDHMRRRVQDEDLRSLMVELNEAGLESVRRLRELMIDLGARPRRTSFRRRALARGLALASRVIGVRFVLRVCMNAEETVGRWYQEYALYLLRLEDPERAKTCQDLAQVKQRHAQALGAWVGNLTRR
jgi:rubrerythrin